MLPGCFLSHVFKLKHVTLHVAGCDGNDDGKRDPRTPSSTVIVQYLTLNWITAAVPDCESSMTVQAVGSMARCFVGLMRNLLAICCLLPRTAQAVIMLLCVLAFSEPAACINCHDNCRRAAGDRGTNGMHDLRKSIGTGRMEMKEVWVMSL